MEVSLGYFYWSIFWNKGHKFIILVLTEKLICNVISMPSVLKLLRYFNIFFTLRSLSARAHTHPHTKQLETGRYMDRENTGGAGKKWRDSPLALWQMVCNPFYIAIVYWYYFNIWQLLWKGTLHAFFKYTVKSRFHIECILSLNMVCLFSCKYENRFYCRLFVDLLMTIKPTLLCFFKKSFIVIINFEKL